MEQRTLNELIQEKVEYTKDIENYKNEISRLRDEISKKGAMAGGVIGGIIGIIVGTILGLDGKGFTVAGLVWFGIAIGGFLLGTYLGSKKEEYNSNQIDYLWKQIDECEKEIHRIDDEIWELEHKKKTSKPKKSVRK